MIFFVRVAVEVTLFKSHVHEVWMLEALMKLTENLAMVKPEIAGRFFLDNDLVVSILAGLHSSAVQ